MKTETGRWYNVTQKANGRKAVARKEDDNVRVYWVYDHGYNKGGRVYTRSEAAQMFDMGDLAANQDRITANWEATHFGR